MARSKKKPPRKDESPEQAEREFKWHLQELGIASTDEYREWCRAQGFSLKKDKGPAQRARERLVVVRQRAKLQLKRSKRQKKRPSEAIAKVFNQEVIAATTSDPQLRALCHAYERVKKKNRRASNTLRSLLLHLQRIEPHFLGHQPALAHLGMQPGNQFPDALASLALHGHCWIRSIETWQPNSHNTQRRFSSLLRHLLAKYEVPTFFDQVWFRGVGFKPQQWFIHVARGNNIRTADLPISYTKRMAHYFMQAPKNYSVEAALRWGQIHALGGNARLVDAISGTRLAEGFSHEDFWITVIRFFIDNPMLDTAHVGPIIDYLADQRFDDREVFVEPGVIERQSPPQPNLSMKGRTAHSLLEQVQRWHRQLSYETGGSLQWQPSRIGGFEFIEGDERARNQKRWTIRELLSAKALAREGRTMRHCVASYSNSCSRRVTSIWSLEVESFEGQKKVLTIEVRLGQRLICQARGKGNALPDDKSRNVLRRWALQEGLAIASYV